MLRVSAFFPWADFSVIDTRSTYRENIAENIFFEQGPCPSASNRGDVFVMTMTAVRAWRRNSLDFRCGTFVLPSSVFDVAVPSACSRSRLCSLRYIALVGLFSSGVFPFLASRASQVSVDVEGEIYRLAGRSGIALFTVSHRKSLWEHHSVSFDAL